MRLRRLAAAAVAGALALVVATSATYAPLPSTAAFSDTVALSPNTVTAGTCPSTTAWSSLVNASFVGAARVMWQRMNATTSAVPNDAWNGDNWSESSLVTDRPGALYCSDDRGISLDEPADVASSPLKTYATWSASSTVTTLLWVRGTSSTPGRLLSLAEGATGGTRYADRALWVTSTGGLVAGGRYSSAASWTTSTSDVRINDGRWHQVTVAWSNTATTNVAPVIRVDGAAAATTTTGTVTYRARSSSGTSAAWYVGANNAGRQPASAPTAAYLADYDELIVVAGTPSATLLGSGPGSLYAAADL